MTLKEWFQKYQARPLKIAAIFLLAVWSVFAARSYLTIEAKQHTYVKQTADLLSISDQQKNRVLAESLLETLISQGGATSAELCNGDKQVMGANQDLSGCKTNGSFYEKIIVARIPGSGTLVLRARFNLISAFSSLFSSLSFALILVFFGFYFIQTAQDRIKKDVFEPIARKLLDQEHLEIKELLDLRTRIQEARELEAQKAVTLAIQENNQQVAHDIRSPVQSINALLKMTEIKDIKLKSALDKAVQRAISVSNLLLNTERVEATEKESQTYNLASVIEDIATEKRPIFSDGQIEVEAPKSLILTSKLSADLLASMLSNIVDNAIFACEKLKIIKICVIYKNDFTEISVIDSGSGIPPEVLSRIGEKGFSRRSQNPGTGRGVYAAKKLLDKVGGSIQFDSSSVGTTVLMKIPAILEPENNVDLVFVDNKNFIRSTWEIWSDMKGLKILTFSSVEELITSVNLISKNCPVFLDSDLDDEKKGEHYAPLLKDIGFKKVILATGYSYHQKVKPTGIDFVIGKDPDEAVPFLKATDLSFSKTAAEFI